MLAREVLGLALRTTVEDILLQNILIQNSGWHVIGSSEQNVGVVSGRF